MQILIIAVHCALSVVLFFTINWIGKHSYSLGYRQVSLFLKNEDAPAFNFLVRVLGPIVYLIIVSTILYSIDADRFVKDIYFVNVYYLIIRIGIGLIIGRGRLINWYRQLLYSIATVSISLVVYDKVIIVKSNILPDFTTLANELWIMIIVFIFQVVNNVQFSESHTINRKHNYLKHYYKEFTKLYGRTVNNNIGNDKVKALAYAIMIYENFNRPKLIRVVENLWFRITQKPHTLGVMQVLTNRIISDSESVSIGTNKIQKAYLNFKDNYKISPEKYWGDSAAIYEIIEDYNGGLEYNSEVSELYEQIVLMFYKDTTDVLVPTPDKNSNLAN